MDTKTLKYVPPRESREKNTFIEEYYSSPDVTITINGSEFSHANELHFSVQEQLKPLYSYVSNTYDDVAIGNRIVVGQITVPIINETKNDEVDFETGVVEDNEDEDRRPGWASNSQDSNSSLYIDIGGDTPSSIHRPQMPSISDMVFSNEIKKVQTALLDKGYNVLVTGFLDTKTKMALSKYQSENGLRITGTPNKETKDHLFGETSNNVVITDVNVHSGPGKNYPIIGLIKASESVTITTTVGDYSYIKTSKQITGYVETSYIKMLQ